MSGVTREILKKKKKKKKRKKEEKGVTRESRYAIFVTKNAKIN